MDNLHLILASILTKIPIYGNMFCSSHREREGANEEGCNCLPSAVPGSTIRTGDPRALGP